MRRKRRSKNVISGRNHVCECGKAYLSQPALTNHIKTKHKINEIDPLNMIKKRGRPKKDVKIKFYILIKIIIFV
jgi:hypothetical protein